MNGACIKGHFASLRSLRGSSADYADISLPLASARTLPPPPHPISISSSCGRVGSEVRSCVKDEVAVLGFPSLIVSAVSVEVKQQLNLNTVGGGGNVR